MNYITAEEFNEVRGSVSALAQQVQALANALKPHATSTTQLAEMQNQINSLRVQLQDAKVREVKQQREADLKEIVNFVEQQIRERRISPAEKEAKINLLLSTSPDQMINFSEGGQTVQKSARQLMMETFMSGPELWSEDELPIGADVPIGGHSELKAFQEHGFAVDSSSVQLDRKIREFAIAKGKDPDDPVQYSEAAISYSKVHGIAL